MSESLTRLYNDQASESDAALMHLLGITEAFTALLGDGAGTVEVPTDQSEVPGLPLAYIHIPDYTDPANPKVRSVTSAVNFNGFDEHGLPVRVGKYQGSNFWVIVAIDIGEALLRYVNKTERPKVVGAHGPSHYEFSDGTNVSDPVYISNRQVIELGVFPTATLGTSVRVMGSPAGGMYMTTTGKPEDWADTNVSLAAEIAALGAGEAEWVLLSLDVDAGTITKTEGTPFAGTAPLGAGASVITDFDGAKMDMLLPAGEIPIGVVYIYYGQTEINYHHRRRFLTSMRLADPTVYYQIVEDNAVDQNQRGQLNFVGFTVADDAGNDRTTITNTAPDPEDVHAHNLVKNYPAYNFEYITGLLPEWWEVGGTATLTEEDATGEGIPQKHERVLKVLITNGGGPDYVYQNFDTDAEPTLDENVTKVSVSAWVYLPSGASPGTVTMQLYDNDAGSSLGTATTTTTDTWVYLTIENITIQQNTQLRFYCSGDETGFYVCMPMMNVGSQVMPWSPRGTLFIEVNDTLASNVDPADSNYATGTFTGSALGNWEKLVCRMMLWARYKNETTAGRYVYVRMYNSNRSAIIVYNQNTSVYCAGHAVLACDDQQRMEYRVETGAGETESLYITAMGVWVWE